MEKNFIYTKALKDLGISYLGSVRQSSKMKKSYERGTLTYCLYLAPWTLSGHNVCPRGEHCHEFCLNGSGHNKAALLHAIDNGNDVCDSTVNASRIKKTRLFYNDRDLFMRLLVHEIRVKKKSAETLGMDFSVRINGTSDLSPELFTDPDTGLNILDLFSDVQFYDYTKVYNRIRLMKTHPNYDVTFSYDGYNDDECKRFLENGGKVAVVFFDAKLPKFFWGYKVEDGNNDDMRYFNKPSTVIGLHYHITANDYYFENGKRKYRVPDTPFVIKINDPRIEWY